MARLAACLISALLSLVCHASSTMDDDGGLLPASPAEERAVTESLHSIDPLFQIKGIYQSHIDGLLQVDVPGGVLYISPDGKYILQGEMHMVDKGQVINLTAMERQQKVARQLAALPDEDMIVSAPEAEEVKATVYIFTDVECPYCRKQHAELKKMHRYGIKVCWLPYPRAGVDSPAGKQLQAVWSAVDRQKAFDQLNAGQMISTAIHPNPVARFRAMGEELGINGTPAVILPSGEVLPGYQTARQLAKKLGLRVQQKKEQAVPRQNSAMQGA
ncbi:DsbC family protein [Endozoicomonadaceae bacterium StTr2]